MLKFSTELLEKNLLAMEDSDKFVTEAPSGIKNDLFNKFVRMMEAKKPSELQDITDEDLIEMVKLGKELFEVMNFEDTFGSDLRTSLTNLQSVNLGRRRVL